MLIASRIATILLSLAALQGAAPVAAAEPFDGRTALAAAIADVRQKAFRASAVDWPALEKDLDARADKALDAIDMLPIYRDLLDALGDGHSFVQTDAAALDAYRARHGEDLYASSSRKRSTSAFVGRREPSGEPLPLAGGKHARLVVIPAMEGGGARANASANALFAAFSADVDASCGYVLDLRGNTGGNVWPMLIGISPLLGDGLYGWERSADGSEQPYARLENGAAVVLDGEYAGMAMARAEAWRPLDATAHPVALLLDDGTASSGEGVAVAFVGRPETRSFGQTSYGVASANEGILLADGVNLVVTTSMMRDRLGGVHPHGVEPDEPTEPGDATLAAARAWLAARPACAAGNTVAD